VVDNKRKWDLSFSTARAFFTYMASLTLSFSLCFSQQLLGTRKSRDRLTTEWHWPRHQGRDRASSIYRGSVNSSLMPPGKDQMPTPGPESRQAGAGAWQLSAARTSPMLVCVMMGRRMDSSSSSRRIKDGCHTTFSHSRTVRVLEMAGLGERHPPQRRPTSPPGARWIGLRDCTSDTSRVTEPRRSRTASPGGKSSVWERQFSTPLPQPLDLSTEFHTAYLCLHFEHHIAQPPACPGQSANPHIERDADLGAN
jgi:hypothetical protein